MTQVWLIAYDWHGKIAFQIYHDPGPEWEKRFYPGKQVAKVELGTNDRISLNEVSKIHDQFPTMDLASIVNKIRQDQEFGV